MKNLLTYAVIAAVLIVGAIAYTGLGGADMATDPRGGFIFFHK